MAITEVNAHLKYVNSSGDTTVIYPITKVDNVEGLNKFIDSTKGVVPISSGGTGASNAATARANLGAAPACTYGTADITVGRKSSAPNGTIHFVYATVDGAWDHVKSIFITVDGVWRLVWDITDGKSSYSIKTNLTGVTGASSNATTIPKNGIVELMFTPSTGYVLPENIVVVGADYIWDYIVGSLILSNPTGDVTVTIVGVLKTYSITTNLTGVTGRTLNPTTIAEDDTASLIFSASSGYTLPSTISVDGASYTWDGDSGALVLYSPTGNVTVTINGIETEPVVYSIFTNLTGVIGHALNPTTITENDAVSLEFDEKTGYEFPDSVSVTGAKYNWSNFGYLDLYDPTGNVTVTINGVLKTYSITTNLTGVTGDSSNLKVMAKDSSATLSFTAIIGYYLPDTVTVTGATYTWTKSTTTTGTLKLSNPTDDITIKIVGDAALVDL